MDNPRNLSLYAFHLRDGLPVVRMRYNNGRVYTQFQAKIRFIVQVTHSMNGVMRYYVRDLEVLDLWGMGRNGYLDQSVLADLGPDWKKLATYIIHNSLANHALLSQAMVSNGRIEVEGMGVVRQ